MSGVRNFLINNNNSRDPLLIKAPNMPPSVLYYNSINEFSAAGNYVVTVMDNGSSVFNINFSGPGGSLDIIPGSNPNYAEVIPNYD